MKYLGTITDNKDLVTKEYVDNKVSDSDTKVTQNEVAPTAQVVRPLLLAGTTTTSTTTTIFTSPLTYNIAQKALTTSGSINGFQLGTTTSDSNKYLKEDGTWGSLTMSIDSTDTKQLNITFG